MEALKKTMFILALITITSYTVRHLYLKWFEPHASVLDKYDKPITSEIKRSNSLEQLERLYSKAHDKVQRYEAMDSIKTMDPYKKRQLEQYINESELRMAINEWETKSREIYEVRFYWSIGLVLIIIGSALYKKINQWLGVATLIIGFAEMIYWTSPSFFSNRGTEYENLLNNKLSLSFVALGLLIVAAYLTGTLKTNSK
jgi:hypothetical protein